MHDVAHELGHVGRGRRDRRRGRGAPVLRVHLEQGRLGNVDGRAEQRHDGLHGHALQRLQRAPAKRHSCTHDACSRREGAACSCRSMQHHRMATAEEIHHGCPAQA